MKAEVLLCLGLLITLAASETVFRAGGCESRTRNSVSVMTRATFVLESDEKYRLTFDFHSALGCLDDPIAKMELYGEYDLGEANSGNVSNPEVSDIDGCFLFLSFPFINHNNNQLN